MSLPIAERDVLRMCLEYLTAKRIFHYRNNTGAVKTEKSFVRFGTPGSPDIVAVVDGNYIGIECKGSDGKQSELQKIFQSNLERAGGIYVLVRTLEDLIAVVG